MQRNAIYLLLLMVAGLIALGLVMLFSTSAFAQDSHGDIYFFVKRQCMWLGIASVFGIGAAYLDYHLWQKYWWAFFGAAALLLLLCFVPHVGMRINGSSRWIKIGMTFQPSELAKVAALFFLAWWYSRTDISFENFKTGLLYPMCILGLLMLLILLEVDMGNTALIGGTAVAVMFVAGAALRWMATLIGAGLAGIAFLAFNISERHGRLLAFMEPEKYALGEGLQQWQALIAFGSGGFDGLGLGEGRQKMLYLPYAHTDFIFPMVGEELGLKFTALTVAAYLCICLCGALVALNAKDRFGMLLGFGSVVMITLQAAVNIGVTTSLLPNKGMPLPFISYGGSNLCVCLALIGLLVNIHLQGKPFESLSAPTLLRPHIEPRA
ncbi:MAG: putative peptidoglycan glycosyltransferase FtsW [bacterium]|nr:cell division protein FtsW [bacterium]NBS51044.1 cell division protein FtsW [Spartobacteria bacterium]